MYWSSAVFRLNDLCSYMHRFVGYPGHYGTLFGMRNEDVSELAVSIQSTCFITLIQIHFTLVCWFTSWFAL